MTDMMDPASVKPDIQPTVLGRVFDAPIVVEGRTGLPLLELFTWGLLSQVAGSKNPTWTPRQRLTAGATTTVMLFASEWGHNLAYAALAAWIGKPVDAIRIFFGTPLLIYYDSENSLVTPAQHITRASGGSIFNGLMVAIAWLGRWLTPKGSLSHYCMDFVLDANRALMLISWLPIPSLDGGSILKWSLVLRGRSREKADEAVEQVNLAVGAGLAASSAIALKKRRKWLGAGMAFFAVGCLGIGLGLQKEQ
jgi:hypothetical protein